MDRSFLLRREVVDAAQKFVCIRLTSYEDEKEKAFIAKLVRGEVANTSFALLTPDGERAVSGRGPGRGPADSFADSAAMAQGMAALAEKYPAKKIEGVPALPIALSAKVGLAVAAGDNQPLVLVVAADSKRRAELEAKVAALAWDKTFQGRLVYASAASPTEIPKLKGQTIAEGILCIEPDIFGMGGNVVAEVPSDKLAEGLRRALFETVRDFVPFTKIRRDLAAKGLAAGIYYETGIEVSGRGEAADRLRYKQALDAKKK